MAKTKSYKEYVATAMLLGMDYDEQSHTFHCYDAIKAEEIDADTLEPVPMDEVTQRIKRFNVKVTPW